MRALVDFLLPLRCAACGVPASQGLCDGCDGQAAALVLADAGWQELGEEIVAIGRWAYDGVVSAAVRGMKLGGRHAAGRPLGAELRAALDLPRTGRGVGLTWVPATPRRRRQRGFDLPELLAGADAIRLLRRVRDRPDQTGLDARARRRNPERSFEPAGRPPRTVVLVDDVRTTGATASAAARALQRAGAQRVLVVTLAVGGDEARASVRQAPRVPP